MAAGGVLLDNGDFGSTHSIVPFKGIPWTANGVAYFEGVGVDTHWAGTTIQGAFDYQFTLQTGQVAWGTFFNWNGANDIPLLNIMDCGPGNIGDVCTGIGTPMQTGPFIGSAPSFNGIVAAPIPAASWLMLSGLTGLTGLVSFARRRKKQI